VVTRLAVAYPQLHLAAARAHAESGTPAALLLEQFEVAARLVDEACMVLPLTMEVMVESAMRTERHLRDMLALMHSPRAAERAP